MSLLHHQSVCDMLYEYCFFFQKLAFFFMCDSNVWTFVYLQVPKENLFHVCVKSVCIKWCTILRWKGEGIEARLAKGGRIETKRRAMLIQWSCEMPRWSKRYECRAPRQGVLMEVSRWLTVWNLHNGEVTGLSLTEAPRHLNGLFQEVPVCLSYQATCNNEGRTQA